MKNAFITSEDIFAPEYQHQAAETVPRDGYFYVSPGVARDWLANYNYEHQRNIRPAHVANLRKEIESGRFRQKTQINFCSMDGHYFLTNGQHTLSAIAGSGNSVLLSVIVLQVADKSEIADDFSRHDTHLTRQISDSLVAHEIDKHFGITRTEMNIVSAACMQYAYMVGEIPLRAHGGFSNDEKLAITRRHGWLAVKCVKLLCCAGGRSYLTRKTTVAACMITMNSCPDICAEFFMGIAKDDGLKQGDPRKTILNAFLNTVSGSVSGVRVAKDRKSDHEFVKMIAVAWNAFVSRKSLSLIRINFDSREVTFDKCGTFRA